MNDNIDQKNQVPDDESNLQEDLAALKENLQESKASFMQTVSDARHEAKMKMKKGKKQVKAYVQNNPLKTLSLAVAAGFISGKIIRFTRFL